MSFLLVVTRNLKFLAFQDPVTKQHIGIGVEMYQNAGSAARVVKVFLLSEFIEHIKC